MSLRNRLTRLHLWVGEALGLTHYRCCWSCRHCHEFDGENRAIVLCDLDYETEGVYAATNPSEAVWCDGYERGDWHREVEDA